MVIHTDAGQKTWTRLVTGKKKTGDPTRPNKTQFKVRRFSVNPKRKNKRKDWKHMIERLLDRYSSLYWSAITLKPLARYCAGPSHGTKSAQAFLKARGLLRPWRGILSFWELEVPLLRRVLPREDVVGLCSCLGRWCTPERHERQHQTFQGRRLKEPGFKSKLSSKLLTFLGEQITWWSSECIYTQVKIFFHGLSLECSEQACLQKSTITTTPAIST